MRIFALKLKKKLNETITQLQQTEKDKAKLEKLLNDSKSSNIDEVDSAKTESTVVNRTENNELEEKVKTLTVALETSKNDTTELDKLKGNCVDLIIFVLFIYFKHTNILTGQTQCNIVAV